jgi:hypothetical protein
MTDDVMEAIAGMESGMVVADPLQVEGMQVDFCEKTVTLPPGAFLKGPLALADGWTIRSGLDDGSFHGLTRAEIEATLSASEGMADLPREGDG